MLRWGLLLASLLGLSVLAPWGGAPASAASGTETSISITNEQYGPYSAGSLFFDSANATFLPKSTVDASHTQLDFFVHDNSNSAHVTLTAPKGSTLQPGIYEHAIAGANAAGQPVDGSRPGINVVIGDITCDEEEGSFDLHELTANSSGFLTSLWVTFRMRCLIPDTQGYMIGDVRWNVPGDSGGVVVGPQDVWWPDEETDAIAQTTRVTVFNPGPNPVQLGTASITGPDAADDAIASDGCSGVTLAPGDTCQEGVSYKATEPGANQATLEIPEVGGSMHTVSLHGFVFSGVTDLSVQSDPGDYLGQGQDFDFVPSNSTIIAGGSYQAVGIVWDGAGPRGSGPGLWAVEVGAPPGQQLTPGTTYTNANQDASVPGPHISVMSPGRSCDTLTGQFTITDIYVDQWGDVERFGVDFDVHCDNSSGDLHGTLGFQLNTMTVNVAGGSVHVSGQVAPNEPGKSLNIELDKKRGHQFILLRRKILKLNHASSYRTKLRRARGGTCRAVAVFKAKTKHLASRTVKQFHC